MGVTYKLKDEVVNFIISQRHGNALFSCRQLAEAASEKFGVHLSKSSVHDVLKESGIITPRGRKPKDKFKIPQEKKKQIQDSLTKVKLFSSPSVFKINESPPQEPIILPENISMEISTDYQGAGRIFVKAALWDLGIFSENNIKETDWKYYLTYCKGIKVVLESDQNIFISMSLPIERGIREATDGLVNNVIPLIVDKISDQELFKACMDVQEGAKIRSVSIVDYKDHIILELTNIVDRKRSFLNKNRIFVENYERNFLERAKSIFFPQLIHNNDVIENILNLKGFDKSNKHENNVSILINNNYTHKILAQEAAEKLNGMCLRDEQNRLVSVKIQIID
ncbi:MAG: helix-turn-helix domain-containing protein [Candidatus Omnitrophica bacterium]|nr:helix-turn-helix domain-containing protein [Candidatus Omnitrophota bacterium]